MSRVALVTGATRGIGRAIAVALKEEGYRVAGNYGGNEEAATRFRNETGIPVYKWDVGDFEACAKGVKAVEAAVGPIEILVNNAGIARDAMLHKMSPEHWRDVLRTNLDSMFNMCRQVVEGMRDRGFGRIINVSSINGQKGQMGQTNYSAAKAGVIGFTKALALECAKKGVTVNAIAPGYVRTEMMAALREDVLNAIIATIPVGRLGEAEDIARCAVFLADDKAGFITGATLSVNGAQYLAS